MTVIEHRHRPISQKKWQKDREIMNPLDNIHWKYRPNGKKAQAYIRDHYNDGIFSIYADGNGGFYLKIHETSQCIPLPDVGYRDDMGLYRKSDHPFLLDE